MSDMAYEIFEKHQVSFFIFASPKSGTTAGSLGNCNDPS